MSSCAYLGDVAPYIPVARRLVDAGHDVTFLAPAGYSSLLAGEPFEHAIYALDFSAAAMHADPRHSTLMKHPMANMARLGNYWLGKAYLDDKDAAEGSAREALSGADVLVTHPTMSMVTHPIAAQAGAQTIIGHLFPMLLTTESWTPPLPYSFRAPTSLNRAGWRLMRSMSSRTFHDDDANDLRRRCGLEPRRSVVLEAHLDAAETVLLSSEHYHDRAPDWPDVSPGGFAVWDGPPGMEMPEHLDRYVDAGDPPVVVTLGTSAATDAGHRFARIRADLDALGIRSVILAGNEANAAALAGRDGVVAFAPLAKLLPRCRAAVVSGALGGIAAALAAGTPAVVHPQLFDQFWHGGQVRRRGVGALARRVSDVAGAVASVIDDATAERARQLAAAIALEDGPGAVVAAVTRCLHGRGR